MAAASSAAALCVASALALLVLLVAVDEAHAKRGCSSFGHSCFGGHGKRADVAAAAPLEDEEAAVQGGPGEVGESYLGSGRDGGNDFASYPRLRVPPFLRQWLESYRRSAAMMERK